MGVSFSNPTILETHRFGWIVGVQNVASLSQYDRNTGEWEMEKAPVYHIID